MIYIGVSSDVEINFSLGQKQTVLLMCGLRGQLNQMNKYPFIVDQHSDYIKISKSGFYKLTYHDFYIANGTIVVYNETNNKDLHRIELFNTATYKFISLTTVFQIELTDLADHNEISIFIETKNNAKLRGKGFSSFYIKYLHD